MVVDREILLASNFLVFFFKSFSSCFLPLYFYLLRYLFLLEKFRIITC